MTLRTDQNASLPLSGNHAQDHVDTNTQVNQNTSDIAALATSVVDATARANHTGTQSADTITDGTTNKAYTAAEKTKLAGIATGATANSSDATLLNRANHTGTQTASTISDLTETVQDVVGAQIVAGTNVTATYNDGAGTVTISATASSGTAIFIDVTAYGATGDGSTDDTISIQSALNAAEAAGGGIVFLPAGTYVISALLVYSYTTILGDGFGTTLKLKNSTNDEMFECRHTQASPTSRRWNIRFTGLKFDLNKANNTTTAEAIDANNVRSLQIDHCKFENYKGKCVNIRGGATSDLYSIQPFLDTLEFDLGDTSSGVGITLGDGCYDAMLSNIDVGRSYRGLEVTPSTAKDSNHAFVNVFLWGHADAGLYMQNASSNQFTNLIVDRNFGHGVKIDNSDKNIFQGGKFSNNSFYDEFNEFGLGVMGTTNTYSGAYFSTSCADTYFVNTLFTNPDGDQKYGIETNGTGNEIYQLNCLFDSNATDGFLQATGSTIRNIDVSTRPMNIGKLAIQGDGIWENETNGSGTVAFNYSGYNGGTTQFRDTAFYDGKNSEVARFNGSSKTLTLTNPLAVGQGGTGATSASSARTNLAVPEASGFAKITVGTSTPASPSTGDLWVDTN